MLQRFSGRYDMLCMQNGMVDKGDVTAESR